jgi:hypothetical protein
MPKKVKDLDPKGRAKKIKGGKLEDEPTRTRKLVQDKVVKPLQGSGDTIKGAIS